MSSFKILLFSLLLIGLPHKSFFTNYQSPIRISNQILEISNKHVNKHVSISVLTCLDSLKRREGVLIDSLFMDSLYKQGIFDFFYPAHRIIGDDYGFLRDQLCYYYLGDISIKRNVRSIIIYSKFRYTPDSSRNYFLLNLKRGKCISCIELTFFAGKKMKRLVESICNGIIHLVDIEYLDVNNPQIITGQYVLSLKGNGKLELLKSAETIPIKVKEDLVVIE